MGGISDDEVRIDHPSFGWVGLSRVQSSGTRLFDSPLKHQHYVTLSIGRATLARRNNANHIYDAGHQGPLIKVKMSEAQFGVLLSTFNSGIGSSCTLEHVGRERMPDPPEDTNTKDVFLKELKGKAAEVGAGAGRLAVSIREMAEQKGPITKRQAHEVRELAEHVFRELALNLPFMMEQFTEAAEEIAARAKQDISAYLALMEVQAIPDDQQATPKIGDQSEGKTGSRRTR